MVTKKFCDVEGCDEEAFESVDVCYGWLESQQREGEPEKKFERFEQPDVGKRDLCFKHYKLWCAATYTVIQGEKKNE